jgi:hypothetical protein
MKRTMLPTWETCSKIHPDRRTPLERFIHDFQTIEKPREFRKQLSDVIEKEKQRIKRRIENGFE